MPEIERLQREVNELKRVINFLYRSDRYLFERDIDMRDGTNIRIGGTKGTKIGFNVTDKLGFYGGTPVVRYDDISFNGVPGATYGGVEQATLAGLRSALLYYNLIHT